MVTPSVQQVDWNKQALLKRYDTTSYLDRLSFYAWDFELGF